MTHNAHLFGFKRLSLTLPAQLEVGFVVDREVIERRDQPALVGDLDGGRPANVPLRSEDAPYHGEAVRLLQGKRTYEGGFDDRADRGTAADAERQGQGRHRGECGVPRLLAGKKGETGVANVLRSEGGQPLPVSQPAPRGPCNAPTTRRLAPNKLPGQQLRSQRSQRRALLPFARGMAQSHRRAHRPPLVVRPQNRAPAVRRSAHGPPARAADQPVTRHLAAWWLKRAYELARIEQPRGSLWHVFRRVWATERKHLPPKDVAAAGGWSDIGTLLSVYQQVDEETLREVVDYQRPRRRERKGLNYRREKSGSLL